ncbi:MAG TPA: hypothetical protein DDW50_18765 [Firmicutes bacterium]|nr:hypothetical protein [Bacillota bacterium]
MLFRTFHGFLCFLPRIPQPKPRHFFFQQFLLYIGGIYNFRRLQIGVDYLTGYVKMIGIRIFI